MNKEESRDGASLQKSNRGQESLRELRRRQAIGLLWLALLVFAFSAWRAGVHGIFLPRWWHLW